MKILTQKEEPDLPQGTILSQTPKSGSQIKPNNNIYVVVSKKPYRTTCPYLINTKKDDLTRKLGEKNIRNKSYLVPSNSPANSCIAQFPSPGTFLKKNNIITYLSSGNKKPVLLPNFRNKNLKEILDFLENYNVKTEVIYTNKYRYGTIHDGSYIVIDQRPLAGSIVTLDKEKQFFIQLQVQSAY